MIKENSPITRAELIAKFNKHKIDNRPIVTGNFLKNTEVLEFFDYEISGTLNNAEYIDEHGLFVGNHHVDIKSQIDYLFEVVNI